MTITPWTIEKPGTEHAHQSAFFAWLVMAKLHGFAAANDEQSYGRPDIAKGICDLHGDRPRPELDLFYAIPNGGERNIKVASRLKAEGVKPGVLDTHLPIPTEYEYPEGGQKHSAWYTGLYVEFKAPKFRNRNNGGLRDKQIEFMHEAQKWGNCCRVAYTWQEAANLTCLYLNAPQRIDTPGTVI